MSKMGYGKKLAGAKVETTTVKKEEGAKPKVSYTSLRKVKK